MHRSLLTALRIASCALVLSGYLALAATPRYPVSIVLLPLAAFLFIPLGEFLDTRYSMYRRVTSVLSALFLLFSIASLLKSDLLGSVIGLLVYIQVYVLLHKKSERYYHYLYLMSFFMLLAACVLTPEAEVGLAMLMFLVSAIVSFMLLQFTFEIERNRESAIPDILSLDGRDDLVLTAPDRIFDAGLIGMVVAVASATLLLTAGIFFMTPRMEAGLLGRTDMTLFHTGVTTGVDLARGGRILRDTTAVMRAEFPDEPDGRYTGPLFWRTTSLDTYRDSKWERLGLLPKEEEPRYALTRPSYTAAHSDGADSIQRSPFGGGREVRQVIYMNDIPEAGVPCLPIVQRLSCRTGAHNVQLTWDTNGDFTVVMNRRGQRWLQYEAVSETPDCTQEQLRGASDDYHRVLTDRDYELLTYQDLLPRTRNLAAKIAADKTTVYDKVAAVSAYLNSEPFQYSLMIPFLPPDHPVDSFIHDVRMGHCELFASSMALMVRSLGIPARVAAGYRGGEWSSSEKAYTIRADMAHLWVEVYFLGLGWVPFDPTPPDSGPSGFAQTWLARTVSRNSLRLKMLWYRDIIGFDRGLQMQSFRNLALGLVGVGSGLVEMLDSAATQRGPRGTLYFYLYLTLGTFVLVGVPFTVIELALLRGGTGLFSAGRRAGRHPMTPDQARAVRLYRRLLRKLRRFNVPIVGKTAEEIRDSLRGREHLIIIKPALEVIESYNGARFGRRPLQLERYKILARALRQMALIKKSEDRSQRPEAGIRKTEVKE